MDQVYEERMTTEKCKRGSGLWHFTKPFQYLATNAAFVENRTEGNTD